ncbi:MAG: Inner rane component of cytoplasmic domain [Myxococcales bacterium]|nr:Inner rane component of cytoplasmic domain [Myxococcales bacterium]
MTTSRTLAAFVAALTLGRAAAASAAPTLIASPPRLDETAQNLTLFVGGVDENGRSLKSASVELLLDGQPSDAPAAATPLSEWSAAAAEASPTWRPPLAVGLVYLWIDGVPSGLLEGIHSFFQRLPPRTAIMPTIYGRLRQGRARLAAADVGRLDELPYLDSYRPNLVDAVALDLGDLAAEDVPIKLLVLVTDGRDFADPKGEGPGDFAALGRRLREAGVTPLVVGFPPRDVADAAQAGANLRDLHDAAGGFLRVLEQSEDLENTLESLGQALADLRRVQVPTPFGWRLFAGAHRVSVRVAAGDQHLAADVGVLKAPGGAGGLVVALGVGLALAALAVVLVLRRRRTGSQGEADDDVDAEAIVAQAHDLIRRGASPQRAVEELSRGRGSAARVLVDLDPEILSDPRFPYFRTRPGRLRIKEIQDILSSKATAAPGLTGMLAEVLADAIKRGLPPDEAAESLEARVTPEETAAFAALSLEDLSRALREASQRQVTLSSPRARGVAVAVQDALRSKGSSMRGVAVGWLVRASGPGRRGETLRLIGARTVLGSGPTCLLRIDADPGVAPEHAEITLTGGEFVIAPLGGAISVEGRPIARRHTLSDGETIEIGTGGFVFKSARSGTAPVTDGGVDASAVASVGISRRAR